MRSRQIHNHIRANVISYVALFFSLGGTTVAATGALDGPAPGTDSVGSLDIMNGQVQNPDIQNNSVGGSKVKNSSIASADVLDNSLTDADVNESTLGTVPSAAQGGTGRYGFTGSCNPETENLFVDCSSVSVPLSTPGRVLIIGQVSARPDSGGEWGLGDCRLEIDGAPIEASKTTFFWDEGDLEGGYENATLTAVSNVLPVGTRFVGIECNERHTGGGDGSLDVPLARMSAVTLSDG